MAMAMLGKGKALMAMKGAWGLGPWDMWGPWGMKGGKGPSPWDMMAMMMMMKGAKGLGKGMAGMAASPSAPSAIAGMKPTQKVFVGGLPKVVSEDTIRDYFSQFGNILEVKMMYGDAGESKGYCFVTFETLEEAKKVYANYDHNMIEGKWVDCKPSSGQTGGGGPAGAGGSKPGDWWCPMCGDLVFAWRTACNSCGFGGSGAPAAAGSSGSAGSTSGQGGKPGDWICAGCQNLVFSHRSTCSKCGQAKGKGTERIGVKQGDWTCPNCGDLVFASKSACSLCHTPKPDEGHSYAPGPSPRYSSSSRVSPY